MMNKEYQRAVRFTVRGIPGHVDKNDWVTFGNCGFHLNDITMDSRVRHVIHRIRNGEQPEPIVHD